VSPFNECETECHVARQIAMEARTPKLALEKSTIPALTGVQLQKALAAYSLEGAINFRPILVF